MRRALSFLVFPLILGILGCGSTHAPFPPQRTKKYTKVISLSPGAAEVMASDADAFAFVGRPAAADWPSSITSVPVVISVKPDYEKIQKIKPDLILYDSSLISSQEIEKLKTTSVGAVAFDVESDTVDGYIDKLQQLGTLLGAEMRMNDYILRIQTEKEAALGAKLTPVPNVAILMPDKSGSDYICGTEGFLGDVVKICGGALLGPKVSKFVPLNPETLVALKPDVILVPGTKTNTTAYDLVKNDPRFATLPAVKSNRIWVIDEDVLLREGQRVDQLIHDVHRSIAPATPTGSGS